MTQPIPSPGGFPVVGVIGGGQLARMMQPPAVALGVQLSDLAESADASAALVIPSAPVGAHDELSAVLAFAQPCDVVTFDHEHVPADVLQALLDTGTNLQPSPAALIHAQDKLAMRARLGRMGIPCPAWTVAHRARDVRDFATDAGWPVVAKTPRGGYDGKGVCLIRDEEGLAELADWFAVCGQPGHLQQGILLEEAVDFTRELAVLVARSPSGQVAVWPVAETVQRDGVCDVVIAPAPGLDERLGRELALAGIKVATELGVTGVLAIEVFEVQEAGPDGASRPAYRVNELAMRPHNSGHWTIDGSVTSQFEQHLRAVLDLPLGDPSARDEWTVMANVFGAADEELYSAYRHVMARDPGAKVQLYGKKVKPGRKIGHVTVCGDDLAEVRARAEHAARYIEGRERG